MKNEIKKHLNKEFQWLLSKSEAHRSEKNDMSFMFKGLLPSRMRTSVREFMSGTTCFTPVNTETELVNITCEFNPYTGFLTAFFSRAIA